MSKASINFQTAKFNSSAHMSRDSFVSYLIEHEKEHHQFKQYLNVDEALNNAKKLTKKLTKRSMQKLAIDNFKQEAVLNIKKDTTIKKIEDLFKKFNEKFNGGFEIFEIALHKDEGVFIDTKYDVNKLIFDSKNLKVFYDKKDVTNKVISLAPNRDIFYNKNNKNWYAEKEFINQIDTTKLQKKMNYHAHITFTKFNKKTGKNIRLQKKDLQEIQTITADEMQMQRGEKNSKTKRLNHYQIKKLQAELNDNKLTNLATREDLQIINKRLRKELEENKAKRTDYSLLENKIKELKIKIKNKDLTIEDLKNTLISKDYHLNAANKKIESLEEEVSYLKSLHQPKILEELDKQEKLEVQEVQNEFDKVFKKLTKNTITTDEGINK